MNSLKTDTLAMLRASIPGIILGIMLVPGSLLGQVNRSIDGTLNHPFSLWGSAYSEVESKGPLAYEDGISAPAGKDRPNPRAISNAIFDQKGPANDPLGLSAYAWIWGQFIDHDIVLSPDVEDEHMDIPVPAGDPYFDPNGTGQVLIPMLRSVYNQNTGTSIDNPRKHINGITAFIDGSGVYGSEQPRADWLRTFTGGKLKTSEGNLLPFNTTTGQLDAEIDPHSPTMAMPIPHVNKWFVAGDVRANENPNLTALHTIFMREHNRLCDMLAVQYPQWDDERLYQKARKIVGGIIQSIVYEEWLPSLGVNLGSYQGYDMIVNPGIYNEFTAAAYRYGHSTISAELPRMDNAGNELPAGNIQLRDAYFNPNAIMEVGGIEPYLIGACTSVEQDVDCKVIDDLRNFLFGPPGAGGLDLAALNINRGRDRGLADFNTTRAAFGLNSLSDFDQITADPLMSKLLRDTYGDINNIDLWVGVLAEDHMDQALFGPTLMLIMEEQFSNLRVGDRFYYENDEGLSEAERAEIKGTLLSDVIRRNSGITYVPQYVFHVLETTPVVNRTIDGTMNNPFNPEWGAAGSNVVLRTPLAYEDGVSTPSGLDRPNPRVISNEIFAQTDSKDDPLDLSAYAWGWGQFIDHDITLSPDHPSEKMDISVPKYDAFFDPAGTGQVVIPMHRSDYDRNTGTGSANPRIHFNGITSFIDASAVYGSDMMRAAWLRTFDDGKLKTSEGNLLPYNTISGEAYDISDPVAPEMAMPFPHVDRYFVAGDIRANENPLLTSLHTIFVREHNRLADELKVENPNWTDEMIYQRARKIVGALMEAVVYEEWLPTLGMEVKPYEGFDQTINPGIMNVFTTAAYRYGHSTIGNAMPRMDNDGHVMPQGDIELKNAFFNPAAIPQVGGIEPYLMGMSTVVEQDFDCHIIDDLRNFLFGPPGAGGLDLASLNLNRGRDRGLADYNTIRKHFGLAPVASFSSLSTNPLLNQTFATVYEEIDKIDPWAGFLAEDHMEGALFGPTAMTIIDQQFRALRDGDRFYYEADSAFSHSEVSAIKNTRLSDIILRNTDISEIQENIFVVETPTDIVGYEPSQMNFKLYPNPAHERINIDLSSVDAKLQDGEVQIVDLFGKIIMSKSIDKYQRSGLMTFELNSSMPAGLYSVKVFDSKNIGTRSFIKVF